jgi:outer membrane protein
MPLIKLNVGSNGLIDYFCAMRYFILIACFIFFSGKESAAQGKWNLRSCVEYAMANNISVKQSDVQSQISNLTFQQSKLSRLPSLNFQTNTALNSGNNQDPVTFTRVTETYLSAGFQLQSSADIFNFFSKRNTIAGNEWELMAAKANVNKIKNDLALSTANAYLQVLLNREQQNITAVQLQQTKSQLDITRKMVDAGSLPELNLTNLEAQLAVDSGNYIAARGNTVQSLLSLKSFMNIDPAQDFDIETPSVDAIPVEAIADLQPEFVYQEALKNQPLQQSNEYKIKAAQKFMAAARGNMYPTLSVFGALSSNYLTFNKKALYDKIITGYNSTGLIADAGAGVTYDVQSPVFTNGAVIGYARASAFGTQLTDNFRKALGISINVNLFNGGTYKTNYEKSKLNLRSVQLQKEQDNQQLKQDIFQAYNAALIALEKFNASKKSVAANEKTYEFAGKRYNIGVLSTFDLITAQNNLLRSKLEYSFNHFDFVFKMKVLEFYKGAGLKL